MPTHIKSVTPLQTRKTNTRAHVSSLRPTSFIVQSIDLLIYLRRPNTHTHTHQQTWSTPPPCPGTQGVWMEV